jgi:AcrR family transcriptional regulator
MSATPVARLDAGVDLDDTGEPVALADLAPRDRLLAVADHLFYDEGIHTVGIDRIIEQAGVAKATLYSGFGSKEGLILAYLHGRLVRRQRRTERALAEVDEPRDRILVVFDVLDRFFKEPGFRGCAFMNAVAESPPDGAVEAAADEARGWTRSLVLGLVRDAGARDPERLTGQLLQLYDGAMVAARMDRDLDAALTAKETAAAIVDAALR